MKSGVYSQGDGGPVDDAVGRLIPNAVGHAVANMFSYTNPITKGLGRIGWKLGDVDMKINMLVPRELKKWANISNVASGNKVQLAMIK